jgi:hypothetical protein
MTDSIELMLDVFAISGGSWMIFGLYVSIRIERFIVKRYEQETDLLSTVYFKEHATFTRSIPGFFSSAIYTSHLLTFIWGWNYFRKRKVYRDIKNADDVIRNFSNQELRWAKWFAICCLIIATHIAAYYLFRSIWPEVFD